MIVTLDHFVEQRIAQLTPEGWRLRLPPSEVQFEVPFRLNQVIEYRIQQLTAGQQRALEGASVAGLTFGATTAAFAAGMSEEDFEVVCEALCRQQSFIRREPASTPASGPPCASTPSATRCTGRPSTTDKARCAPHVPICASRRRSRRGFR